MVTSILRNVLHPQDRYKIAFQHFHLLASSRTTSGDLTGDFKLLSRDIAVKITCESTTSKSVQFTTYSMFL